MRSCDVISGAVMSGTKGSRGPAAATRAAVAPGGSVCCACHAKGSRGPAAEKWGCDWEL